MTGEWAKRNWYWLAGAAAVGAFVFMRRQHKTPEERTQLDTALHIYKPASVVGYRQIGSGWQRQDLQAALPTTSPRGEQHD